MPFALFNRSLVAVILAVSASAQIAQAFTNTDVNAETAATSAFGTTADLTDEQDLALVQSYLRSHESVAGKSVYKLMTTSGALASAGLLRVALNTLIGIANPEVKASPLALVLLTLAGIDSFHVIRYGVSGGRLGKMRMQNWEAGVPYQAHAQGAPAQLSAEELARVQKYIEKHRSGFARFVSMAAGSTALDFTRVLLLKNYPQAQLLFYVASLALITEGVVGWATHGRVSVTGLGHLIDRNLGIPSLDDVEKAKQAEYSLQKIVAMSAEEGAAEMQRNPHARLVVKAAASLLSQDQSGQPANDLVQVTPVSETAIQR